MDADAGMKVKLILKNNYHYNGTIRMVDDKFLIILDKFGKTISISKDSIMMMELEEE